ncbi:MAG: hypothetical protein LUD27_08725 [Clostridia bacterium]|nr:hypothetical protein [Clostridia bacterium]
MKKFGAKKIAALSMAMAIVTVGAVYATWSYSDASMVSTDTSVSVSLTEVEGSGAAGTYEISRGSVQAVYKLDQYSYAIQHIGSADEYTYLVLPSYDTSATNCNYIAIVSYSSSEITYVNLEDLVKYASGTTGLTATASSSVYPDYTATLGIAAGSALTITFTADQTNTSADAYNYGIETAFALTYTGIPQFKCSAGTASGTTNYYYYNSNGSYLDVLTVDSEAKYIYDTNQSSSGGKVWTSDGSGVFTYTISAAELATYIQPAKIFVLNSYSDYEEMNEAIQNLDITFTVKESGGILTTPTITVDNSGNYTIATTATTEEQSGTSTYRIGFFLDNTSGSPIHTVDINTSSTTGSIATLLNSDGASYGYTLASGTYYIKVRAVSSDSDTYSNSLWSSISGTTVTVTVTNTGSAYTCTFSTTTVNSI